MPMVDESTYWYPIYHILLALSEHPASLLLIVLHPKERDVQCYEVPKKLKQKHKQKTEIETKETAPIGMILDSPLFVPPISCPRRKESNC